MLLSLLALSILFIPFTLTEAACRPPVLDTHAQYGLNLTVAGWLKSGTVRFGLKRPDLVRRPTGRLNVYGALNILLKSKLISSSNKSILKSPDKRVTTLLHCSTISLILSENMAKSHSVAGKYPRY